MEESKKQSISQRKFWLIYLAVFTVVYGLVTLWFWSDGRSLCWEHDGLTQHYKAAVWYGEYLRGGIRALFSGTKTVFPHFNVSVGEGADVFQAFHYYVLGDPFALFTVFFTRSTMYLYFYLSVFMRLVLAGAAFILFYREVFADKKTSAFALWAGALCYAFCDWSLYNLNRHIFFLNPLLYLPLLLLGVERIFKKRRPALFILAVCVSALSNFYFFYMLVLVVVLYVAIRWLDLFGKKKHEGVKPFLTIVAASLLGVAMAAVVLVPVLGIFLRDERMSSGNSLQLLYPLKYYMRLASFLIKPGNIYWTRIGTSTPVLFGLLIFFQTGEWKKKTSRSLLTAFVASVIMLLIPAFGQIMNGFSYVSNRWTWAFALLVCILFTAMWEPFLQLDKRGRLITSASFGAYLLLTAVLTYVFDNPEDFACVLANGAIGVGFLVCGFWGAAEKNRTKKQESEQEKKQKQKQEKKQEQKNKTWIQSGILPGLCIAGILAMAAELYSPFGADYASATLKNRELERSIKRSQGGAAKEAAKEDGIDTFYRFGGDEEFSEWNTALLVGNSTTAYYWSISNPYQSRYIDFFQTGEDFAFQSYGYHLKAIPTTLSAVRYYVTRDKDPLNVPYGFSFSRTVDPGKKNKGKKKDQYQIYTNDYAVSALTTYDSFLTEEEAERLSAPGRQMAMLEHAITECPVEGLAEGSAIESARETDYTMETVGKKVTASKNKITVGKKESGIRLSFEPYSNCEPYLVIENLNFETLSGKSGPTQVELSVEANGEERILTHNLPNTRYYRGVHDYTLCLTNRSETLHEIEITFSNQGVYTYDDLKLMFLPMDEYPSLIEERKTDTKDAALTIGRDEISANIAASKEELLCFSFPYSEGWEAYLDGEPVSLYRVNIKNMGVMLPAGNHEVKLVYHTPLLGAGCVISLLGWLVFAGLLILQLRGKQKSVR